METDNKTISRFLFEKIGEKEAHAEDKAWDDWKDSLVKNKP